MKYSEIYFYWDSDDRRKLYHDQIIHQKSIISNDSVGNTIILNVQG